MATNFEVVKDFVYLGCSINTDNDISLEIRRSITLANRCYFALRKQLSKIALSWRTQICLYKSLILPVLLYCAETWTMASSDEQAFVVFERKILLKIYGPFYDRGEWRIRWNQALYDIRGVSKKYREFCVFSKIIYLFMNIYLVRYYTLVPTFFSNPRSTSKNDFL